MPWWEIVVDFEIEGQSPVMLSSLSYQLPAWVIADLTHRNSSDLLVWDSIMPKMKKTYDDIRKQLEPYMNKDVAKF